MLLESNAKRCPACHSKLWKRRGKPIVLGEASRLDMQATLLVDRQNRKRLEQQRNAEGGETFRRAEFTPMPVFEPFALVEPARPMPEPEVAFVPPEREVALAEPEAVVAKPWFEEPEVVVEPEPEPEVLDAPVPDLEPYPFFEPIDDEVELAPEPAATPSFLDVALAEHVSKPAAPAISQEELDAALDGDVNSVVDALHRKARSERIEVDAPPVQLFEEAELPSGALRVMAPASSTRRRWNVDVKSQRGDGI